MRNILPVLQSNISLYLGRTWLTGNLRKYSGTLDEDHSERESWWQSTWDPSLLILWCLHTDLGDETESVGDCTEGLWPKISINFKIVQTLE